MNSGGLGCCRDVLALGKIPAERPLAVDMFPRRNSRQHKLAMIGDPNGNNDIRIPDQILVIGVAGLRSEGFRGSVCFGLTSAGYCHQLQPCQTLRCGDMGYLAHPRSALAPMIPIPSFFAISVPSCLATRIHRDEIRGFRVTVLFTLVGWPWRLLVYWMLYTGATRQQLYHVR